MLELRGATVTIDAMGCQKEIVKQIVDAKADYGHLDKSGSIAAGSRLYLQAWQSGIA